MSSSKDKNFGEIISKLRQQVSDNCDSIKKLTESSNEILQTVSRLEDSMAALIELKISEACSSILARLDALEKFRISELSNRVLSKLVIQNTSWTSKEEAYNSVLAAFPELQTRNYFVQSLSVNKILVDFPSKSQRKSFQRLHLGKVRGMYFNDFVPRHLSYTDYCLKRYGHYFKTNKLVSAYNILFRNGDLIMRVQLVGSKEWTSFTTQMNNKKLPAVKIPDLLSETEFWDKKNETRGRVPAKTGSHKRPRSEDSGKTGGGSGPPGLQAPANKHAITESPSGSQVSVLPIEADEEL